MTDDERAAAARRVAAKRNFRTQLGIYVIVNLFMVAIWVIQGADGSFWPIWVIVPWGVALAFQGWRIYSDRGPITESDIDKELGT